MYKRGKHNCTLVYRKLAKSILDRRLRLSSFDRYLLDRMRKKRCITFKDKIEIVKIVRKFRIDIGTIVE